MHERIGQGQSQGDGFRGTVEHAGFAVPAFLGEFHHRALVHLAIKHKDVGIADIRACATANAFFLVDNRRHWFSLLEVVWGCVARNISRFVPKIFINNFNVLTKQTQGSFADFAHFMKQNANF